MRLNYNECNSAGNIMKDFAKYDKVSEYLQAVIDAYENQDYRSFEMLPLECAYKDISTGKACWIVQGGRLHKDAQKNVNKLKRQRVMWNYFIRDELLIQADAFERECFFSWD